MASTEEGLRERTEGGENEFVVLELELVTEMVSLGSAVVLFSLNKGLEPAWKCVGVTAGDSEPTNGAC